MLKRIIKKRKNNKVTNEIMEKNYVKLNRKI